MEVKPEIGNVKIALLNDALNYASNNSKFYKSLLAGQSISSVDSLDAFQKIPFTEKADLTKYRQDFWCVDSGSIRDFCSTSGSEGHPLTIPLTENDLDRLARNEAHSFATAGIKNGDIIQLCTTIDKRFMAGLAYHLGARKIGAGIIRTGAYLPEYQWRTILELKPSTLIIVPSFLVKLLAFAEENGIDPAVTSVKRAICIGESIRNPDFSLNALGTRIFQKWQIDLHATYASSEMQTAFTECTEFKGGHYDTALIYPEIIDENEQVLPHGQSGELVITTFGIEGMPLLRYKTGDITCLHPETCSCGHSSMRIGPIQGRKNQMIKVKGTSCYPPALIEIVNGIEAIQSFQIQVFHDELNNDSVRLFLSSQAHLDLKILADLFRSRARFAPEIILVSPEELHEMVYPENSRKAILFKDLRLPL